MVRAKEPQAVLLCHTLSHTTLHCSLTLLPMPPPSLTPLQVDYLKGEADLEDLQGLTREEMARGLQKVVGGWLHKCCVSGM
jgi:hypothetical protein